MEGILYTIGPIIAGLIGYILIEFFVTMPGRIMQKNFLSLGTLTGKSYNEICEICGAASSVSYINGKKLCQWMATGYHVALMFDENDICEGVTHETAV